MQIKSEIQDGLNAKFEINLDIQMKFNHMVTKIDFEGNDIV